MKKVIYLSALILATPALATIDQKTEDQALQALKEKNISHENKTAQTLNSQSTPATNTPEGEISKEDLELLLKVMQPQQTPLVQQRPRWYHLLGTVTLQLAASYLLATTVGLTVNGISYAGSAGLHGLQSLFRRTPMAMPMPTTDVNHLGIPMPPSAWDGGSGCF